MNLNVYQSLIRSGWTHAILTFCLCLTLLNGCGRPDTTSSRTTMQQGDIPRLTPTLTGPEQGATTRAIRQTSEAEEQIAMATALALPTPTDGPPEPLPTPSLATPYTGLDVCRDVYPRLKDTNCWLDRVNDVYVSVVAGAHENDRDQGAVVVTSFSLRGETLMRPVWYDTPSRVGAVGIDAVNNPYLHLVTKDQVPFVFNVATLTWENPTTFQTATPTPDVPPVISATPVEPTALPYGVPTLTATVESLPLSTTTPPARAVCEIYPIALPAAIINGATVGQTMPRLEHGSAPGNFGWLSWIGVENIGDLLTSLMPPGTIGLYHNPLVTEDRTLSVGDTVWGRPGAPNTQSMRDALGRLVGQTMTVPVWDTVTREGAKTLYHVSGFAQVQLLSYEGAAPDQLTLRYLGPVSCDN